MKYIEYYPKVLSEIIEIQILSEIFDKEFSKINLNRSDMLKELFVFTAENIGLERLETMFDINVIDYNNIELRRINIITKLMGNKPNLIKTLDLLIGKNNYTVQYFDSDFLLKITVGLEKSNLTNAVKLIIDEIVPLNVIIGIYLIRNKHNDLRPYKHSQLGKFTHSQLMGMAEI